MLGWWNTDRSRGSDCNELMRAIHQFEKNWANESS